MDKTTEPMNYNLLGMLKSLAKINATAELRQMFERNKVWVHVKSGKVYAVSDVAYDCTNSSEGQILVIYKPLYEKFDHPVYAREIDEFLEKFMVNI